MNEKKKVLLKKIGLKGRGYKKIIEGGGWGQSIFNRGFGTFQKKGRLEKNSKIEKGVVTLKETML